MIVTEEGIALSHTLWYKPVKDERAMAYLAAVDTIDEHPRISQSTLATGLPFVHGIQDKSRLVQQWIDEGLLQRD